MTHFAGFNKSQIFRTAELRISAMLDIGVIGRRNRWLMAACFVALLTDPHVINRWNDCIGTLYFTRIATQLVTQTR